MLEWKNSSGALPRQKKWRKNMTKNMDRKLLSREHHETDYAKSLARGMLKDLNTVKTTEIILVDIGKNSHALCAGSLKRICKLALRKAPRK